MLVVWNGTLESRKEVVLNKSIDCAWQRLEIQNIHLSRLETYDLTQLTVHIILSIYGHHFIRGLIYRETPVSFLDEKSVLYTKTMEVGDFVFPVTEPEKIVTDTMKLKRH